MEIMRSENISTNSRKTESENISIPTGNAYALQFPQLFSAASLVSSRQTLGDPLSSRSHALRYLPEHGASPRASNVVPVPDRCIGSFP